MFNIYDAVMKNGGPAQVIFGKKLLIIFLKNYRYQSFKLPRPENCLLLRTWRLGSFDLTTSTAAPVRKPSMAPLLLLLSFFHSRTGFNQSHCWSDFLKGLVFIKGHQTSGDQHRGGELRCSNLGHRAPAQVGLALLTTFIHSAVEGIYCKRPIQCLASSKILTPHLLIARRVCTPPPLVRGEDTLPGWRGGGGSIF
jgi:hypothetical protein